MKAINLSPLIISYFDNSGDLITNKKLQKLLYYVEAWSLVHLSSIIDEDFEAWVHGPVIPQTYHNYKTYGYLPISNNYEKGISSSQFLKNYPESINLSNDHKELIFDVLQKYGSLASYQLEQLSHNERPWLEARKGLSPFEHSSNKIDKSIMKEFYSSFINAKK